MSTASFNKGDESAGFQPGPEISTGLKNYSVFKKHPDFRWPLWINSALDQNSKYFRQVTCPLINHVRTDYLPFNNFLSGERIQLDYSGMVSTSYADWSVEFWLSEDGNLSRPQDNSDASKISRNLDKNQVQFSYKAGKIHMTQSVFGARSEIDEAVIELDCSYAGNGLASLLIVVRPYNSSKLGCIESIEYIKDDWMFKINGSRHAALVNKPDFIITGNSISDINTGNPSDSMKSVCAEGLATIAAGYNIKKGQLKVFLRIGLDARKSIASISADFSKAKHEFTVYSKAVVNKGFNLNISDSSVKNWFYASKISCLNSLQQKLAAGAGKEGFEGDAFWTALGYNRMGYFSESAALVAQMTSHLNTDYKNYTFRDLISSSYTLLAIADLFSCSRDTDFVQSKYPTVHDLSGMIIKSVSGIKKISDLEKKPGDTICVRGHAYCVMLLAYSLKQAAYIARCLGIFGDENRFEKESEKLDGIISHYLIAYDDPKYTPGDDTFINDLHAAFPFRTSHANDDKVDGILGHIKKRKGGLPVYIKSMGVDIYSTMIALNAMLINKDLAFHSVFYDLMKLGGTFHSFSSFFNPYSGAGIGTDDSSSVLGSMFFVTLRNALFMDGSERLDIIPVPYPEWFTPGFEINFMDAPSRFGNLSVRILSTSNEVQVQFEKLPKFVPPEIMINLPFKAKLVPAEDFMLKKEHGNSFIINGWPSTVRFIKK